jgi:hypothetical protein
MVLICRRTRQSTSPSDDDQLKEAWKELPGEFRIAGWRVDD